MTQKKLFTEPEARQLIETVDRGMDEMRIVAYELAYVRDKELYRPRYDSFADYCEKQLRLDLRMVDVLFSLVDPEIPVADTIDAWISLTEGQRAT
jgi:hypothetical protein